MKDFKVAVCQNKALRNKDISLKNILSMIGKAALNGANLILLPEMFYFPYECKAIPDLEETDKHTINILKEAAKLNNVYICTGSTVEKEHNHRFNKSTLIDLKGNIILEYCKTHLFDAEINNKIYKESLLFDSGNVIQIADTELGKIGIVICYDIRFPEVARALALQGTEIILVPAAFSLTTGAAHWEVFLRCRAVENQVFLCAASTARDPNSKHQTYGHSMIIDPWGTILIDAGIDETIIYGDLSVQKLKEVRENLPPP